MLPSSQSRVLHHGTGGGSLLVSSSDSSCALLTRSSCGVALRGVGGSGGRVGVVGVAGGGSGFGAAALLLLPLHAVVPRMRT